MRGRRLDIAPGSTVRPTPDRVRETLFNWLQVYIDGARCLDLYAGTGALGFEALSRGASSVWFVERDPALVAALEQHAALLDVAPRIVRQDAASLLKGHPPQSFDIVFLDPPFDVPVEPLLALLRAWLAPQGVVYVERARAEGLPAIEGGHWRKQAHAGAVAYGLLALDDAPQLQ